MSELRQTAVDLADRYRKAAHGHLNCAEIVHERLVASDFPRVDSTWIALQNIIGTAAECGFKGYLASHGWSQGRLRSQDIRHDLGKLCEHSKEMGLEQESSLVLEPQLWPALQKVSSLIGEDYGAFGYRYIKGNELSVFSPGEATGMALKAIRFLILVTEIRVNRMRPPTTS